MSGKDWGRAVRRLLADVLQRPPDEVATLPDATRLFGPELNLDSFSGMALLALIASDYGLDIASDDIGLESLETIGTLAAYVSRQ
ncbi:MAG: acyl carrier protein [Chloroflexia bacterium]